jgi:hypothetical protein
LAVRLIGRAGLAGLLVSFLAGMAIGVTQAFSFNQPDGQQGAIFAYKAVGVAMDNALASIMALLSLDAYAATLQIHVFSYLEAPFQLCAAAGAYITTVGTIFLTHIG